MVSGNVSPQRGAKPPRVSKSLKEMLAESVQDDLIITPALKEFLVGWDENYPPEVVAQVTAVMNARQRDRSASWSASGAGKCWRRQELAFLGMPVFGYDDPQLELIFLNGRWVHLRWQATLLTAGLLDSIEVTVKHPRTRTRCSMDGEGIGTRGRFKGREFGFELKGRNDWQWNKQFTKGADEETRKQVDFEFLLSGFDLFVILNENKNNQATKEWIITREDDRIQEMKKQIKDLNRAIDIQRLHPMLDECKKGEGEWKKCPYGSDGGACQMSGKFPSTIP